MTLTRRAFLAGLAAGLLCEPAPAATPAATRAKNPALVLRRWPTGNARLAPPARAEGLVLFAGDQGIGVIRPDRNEVLWSAPHGLAGAAAFRPRATGSRLICGGPRGIACWGLSGGERRWGYRPRVQAGVPLVSARRT